MAKSRIVLAVLLLCSTMAVAETKITGEMYPQWHMDFSEGADNYSEFELGRAYINFLSDINEQTSVRVTTDLRSTTGFSGYSIILKFGFVEWNPKFSNRLSFRFGLQPTSYINSINKIWGRRYVEKPSNELTGFLSGADLGASAKVDFGKSGMTTLDVALFNGTAFTDINDNNKQKDINGVLSIKPGLNNPNFKNSIILGQIYLGTQNKDFSGGLNPDDYRKILISIGGIVDYADRFSIGLDANWRTLGDSAGSPDIDASATSIFATYLLARHTSEGSLLNHCNLFGRIDFNEPDGTVSNDGETYSILGIECATSASIKTSLNVRTISYENSALAAKSFLYFNALLLL